MSLAFWLAKTWLSPRILTNQCSTISAVVSYHLCNHSPEEVFIGMRWYRSNLNRVVGGFVKCERYKMRLEYCLSGTLYLRYPRVLHSYQYRLQFKRPAFTRNGNPVFYFQAFQSTPVFILCKWWHPYLYSTFCRIPAVRGELRSNNPDNAANYLTSSNL